MAEGFLVKPVSSDCLAKFKNVLPSDFTQAYFKSVWNNIAFLQESCLPKNNIFKIKIAFICAFEDIFEG